MKFIFLFTLLFTIGCAQKYQTYSIIKKSSFVFGEEHSPISKKMLPAKKDIQETCEGQFLFSRNAKQITINSIPALIKYSCPQHDYLLNIKLTETWWTTLVYSRSCIKIESYCPLNK